MIKLYILDLGKIVMEGANPVTTADDRAAEKPAIPIYAVLLDTPEGKILFDTGCIPTCMDGAWPARLLENPYVPGPDGSLLEQLEQLGVAPEEIDCLVMSHLHLDHAGCVHCFPNAKVLVQQDELENVMRDYENGTLGIFHLPCDIENWKKADVKWQPVPSDTKELKLCEGVTVLNLGIGHSYGMLALMAELQDKNFLVVADAVYARVHYGPPAQLSGEVLDEKGYFDSIEFVRAYAQEHHAEVLFGHDMEQFRSLKKSKEGFYC